MLAVKIDKIDIPSKLITHIKITRKGSIQDTIDSVFGRIEIIASSMHYREEFNELFTLRKSYNDTIVREVAIGTHVIRHKFKFTSTMHRGEIGESANEIHITLESTE